MVKLFDMKTLFFKLTKDIQIVDKAFNSDLVYRRANPIFK